MSNRLAPIAEPFAPDVAEILQTYPHRDGYILKLFRVFANSTRFLRKGVTNLLDRESPLPLRTREIVILRVTANLRCEYEWGVHVTAFGGAAGFTEEQIQASHSGDDTSPCWSGEEALLIQVVDELCATGTLSETTRAGFEQAWTLEQQLEILALCGNYHTISYVANVAGLDREAFGATFPRP
jgi:alkylhydroperoxidase/carboxymuconolactone decarboxylase family protein YurZ